MIVAVFVPDFVVALERNEQPCPLVVFETKGGKRVVTACCPAAKRQGVTVGMALTRAHALCPDVREVEAHPRSYQRSAHDLCVALLPFSDRIEWEISASLTVWLDLGKRGLPDCIEAANHVLAHCLAIAPAYLHVGLAEGRLTSRIAAVTAQKNTLRAVSPGQEKALLARLTISQFQTGERFRERCERLGIKTLADLGGLPYNAVKTRLGEAGAQLHRLYHGVDRKTLAKFSLPLREEVTCHFDDAVENTTTLQQVMAQLAEQLASRLLKAGLACGEVGLTLVCDNHAVHRPSRTLRLPVQHGKALCEELLRLLSLVAFDSGVISLTVHLERLTPPVPEQLDFFDALFGSNAPFVDTAVKRLSPRHEDTPLLRVAASPERSLVVERNSVLTPVSSP